jgi:hypothetical protein
VDGYLLYTRTLLEQASHTEDKSAAAWRQAGVEGGNELIPMESDEQALVYLYRQKYKVNRAELRLVSELGMHRGASELCPVSPA